MLAQNYENRIRGTLTKLFNKKIDVIQNEEENIKLINNPFWKVKQAGTCIYTCNLSRYYYLHIYKNKLCYLAKNLIKSGSHIVFQLQNIILCLCEYRKKDPKSKVLTFQKFYIKLHWQKIPFHDFKRLLKVERF